MAEKPGKTATGSHRDKKGGMDQASSGKKKKNSETQDSSTQAGIRTK